ncbi:helicase associated domain-containing protein [Streptomyces sp. NPDC058145]|uniref:helicase associated domain-containing protein n=1 Tax=Streptomyces sp. NPDC058145 TaxID=3346356 RepID=UPI0036E889E3
MAPAAKTAEHLVAALPEQQDRLSTLGVQPTEAASSAPTANRTANSPSKRHQAFQRGLVALAQYVAREGHHRIPKGHSEEITMAGEAAPVIVKLGVWITNTKTRRDKLTEEQLDALRKLGIDWT